MNIGAVSIKSISDRINSEKVVLSKIESLTHCTVTFSKCTTSESSLSIRTIIIEDALLSPLTLNPSNIVELTLNLCQDVTTISAGPFSPKLFKNLLFVILISIEGESSTRIAPYWFEREPWIVISFKTTIIRWSELPTRSAESSKSIQLTTSPYTALKVVL